MYKKYNIHRILAGVILGSCFFFGYKAVKSRKIVSVNNSVLTQIIGTKFAKNEKIK
jgi:predicted negative regulator of RcsB-dependent stress response